MEKETDVEFLQQLKDIESKITKGEWFWDGGDLLSNDGRSYDLLIITAKYVVQDSNMKGIVALRNGFKRLLSLAEAGRQRNSGASLIAAERERQMRVEGWTTAHDDAHENGSLSQAGICYAQVGHKQVAMQVYAAPVGVIERWPWGRGWWKPKPDPIRNLVIAGALIAAEIDRLLRKAPPSAPVLPESWGPANRKGEYQVIDTVLPEPNSFQKLRKVMALSEIYYDTPGKIADAATTRIRHLEAKPDAVLPEGQPQKMNECCKQSLRILASAIEKTCPGLIPQLMIGTFWKVLRGELEWPISHTSGEPQKGTE